MDPLFQRRRGFQPYWRSLAMKNCSRCCRQCLETVGSLSLQPCQIRKPYQIVATKGLYTCTTFSTCLEYDTSSHGVSRCLNLRFSTQCHPRPNSRHALSSINTSKDTAIPELQNCRLQTARSKKTCVHRTEQSCAPSGLSFAAKLEKNFTLHDKPRVSRRKTPDFPLTAHAPPFNFPNYTTPTPTPTPIPIARTIHSPQPTARFIKCPPFPPPPPTKVHAPHKTRHRKFPYRSIQIYKP